MKVETEVPPLFAPDGWAIERGVASVHDLDRLAREVHAEYFRRHEPIPIRWGQRIQRARRRSIRLGSYNSLTREIRIHPLLDSPLVPPFFIQSIIFHEYLHHVLGPRHNSRFHEREKRFRQFDESKRWLRRNLALLLGRSGERRRHPRKRTEPVAQMTLFQ